MKVANTRMEAASVLDRPEGLSVRSSDAGKHAVSTGLLLGLASAAASAYFAALGLLLHWNFYSFGWDLGLVDQVLWNTAHGRFFEYSFRDMSYLGDHFSPALGLLSPLALLGLGPAPLLVVQGLAFGLAAVPLFHAVRRVAGSGPAWLLTGAYLLSLFVIRAVAYDFHMEAFVPPLAFTALWGLAARRPVVFAAASLALLPLKEDMFLLVLALCWLAWVSFGVRRPALVTAGAALCYTGIVILLLMPHYSNGGANPMGERYPYLGDDLFEMVWNALAHPGRVLDHIARWRALEAVLLLLAGVGFLPLLIPRLWPALVPLLLVPLLAVHPEQSVLELHYGVVPGVFVVAMATAALKSRVLPAIRDRLSALPAATSRLPDAALLAPGAAMALAIAIFAGKSTAPPSFAADADKFAPGEHASVARSFVDVVPPDARVSAQSNFLPHLTHRLDIYEFPRVADAEYVLLDNRRELPVYAETGFPECVHQLPGLGFQLLRSEDGITLWRRPPDMTDRGGCNG